MRELKLKIKEIKITYEDVDTGTEYSNKARAGESNIKLFLWNLIKLYYEYYKPLKMSKNKEQPAMNFIIEDKE